MTDNIKRQACFLADYASLLLSSGATTQRTEINIDSMAEIYNVQVTMTILPMHVELVVSDDTENVTLNRKCGSEINLSVITQLCDLKDNIVNDGIGMEEAEQKLGKIAGGRRHPEWSVIMFTGFANASFCRLFGGDFYAMMFVLLATVCGFYSKMQLTHMGVDNRITTMIVASMSTIISCGAYIFGLGDTPETAVATSVLYLVPGIPFINAFSDFLHRHYICSICRMFRALEITVCLGFGLFLGNYIINL